jgi:hypothetical protein
MTAMPWLQIAALTSALGLTGTAVAIDTDGTTSTDKRSSASSPDMDTPSSGAIVMPEDKAMGLGKHNEHAGNRNGDVNDDTTTLNDNTSNDDELGINPGPSNDEELSVNPGRADMDDASPRYGTPTTPGVKERDSMSTLDENESAPARTGSDVQPGDMGPGNVRGE